VRANVAQRGRPEQRVGNRVRNHIGVRVSDQPALVRDVYARQDETTTLGKTV
jgi:hypothetical protein